MATKAQTQLHIRLIAGDDDERAKIANELAAILEIRLGTSGYTIDTDLGLRSLNRHRITEERWTARGRFPDCVGRSAGHP